MEEIETNELERILASEAEFEPPANFSARVMRAVREEAAAPPPIPFPWVRFLPGFLLNLALLIGATVWVISKLEGASPVQPFPVEWFADPQVQGLLWAALTVVGSGLLAWTASRWSTPRRAAFF